MEKQWVRLRNYGYQWEVAKRLNAFQCRFVVQAISVVLPFSGCVAKRLLTPTNDLDVQRFAAFNLIAGLLHSQSVSDKNITSCCPCKAESSSVSTTIQHVVSTLSDVQNSVMPLALLIEQNI